MTPAATLDSDDIHLMTQVGFIAAGRADVHHAERIFGALALARPQHDFPHVGMAAALLNAGRPADDLEPEHRELLIPFGASGYMLFYEVLGETVLILAVKHQKEAGY